MSISRRIATLFRVRANKALGDGDTLDSPHRSPVHPVVDYVRQAQQAGRQVAVLILEIQPRRLRYRILQNQRGLLLATVPRASTDVVICTIPYRLTTR
jgi:hypothetical protein